LSHAPQFRLGRLGTAPLRVLLVISLWVPSTGRGEVPRSHQAWSTDEGLPDSSVHQVFQSRDGYLWLATEGGVVRFDGSAFRIWRHETDPAFLSNDIGAIAQDSAGALWFGTADGLVRSRGSVLRRFSERDGLPSPAVLSLAAISDGSLLVLTSRGAVSFDGARFKPLPATDETVISLQITSDGAVWLITDKRIERYQHGAAIRQPIPSAISANSAGPVVGLQYGPNGAVWTRSARSVSMRLPGLERTFQVGHDLSGSRITALYVDRQGTGWIGTNRGLFSIQPAPKATVESVDPLRGDSILSIMEDRESNLWIGTETSGLHVLRPRKFRSEPAAAGDAVTAGAAASDGTLWFGTREDGVRRIEDGVAEQPVPITSLTSPVILSMAPGNHADVWVGTPDGLNQITSKKVQQYTSSNGLPDDFVRSVLVDSGGTVWAGTRRGLARIEGRKVVVLTHQDGLGSDSIGPLLESKAEPSGIGTTSLSPELWVGTSGGLSHIQGNHIENFLPYRDQTKDVVSAIARANDGSLWIGLHGEGLLYFADRRFIPVRSSAIPSEITSLFVDREGYLWLRSVRGVYRVSVTQLRACANESTTCSLNVSEYGVADGIPSDATFPQGMASIWQATDGELWFATPKGIGVVDPAHLPVNSLPPPVLIQRFVVDDSDIPFGAWDVRIGPGHNRYTFDYAALSYTLPSKNRYRYMLEGFDRNWLDAGTVRVASYTSLPPGQYRFRVRAQNNDGIWNETGAELSFYILPPIYKRWWFYLLVLLAVAALAGAIFHVRLQAVQRRFALVLNERNRMAREIHDTLAQDFVGVSLQLEIASQMLRARDTVQAVSELDATRKLVKEALEAARQSIWNLRANPAEGSLPTRFTALVNRYAEMEHPPRLKIGGAYRALEATLEDNVLRIAQEGLANAYRHAAATEVMVQLHYDPSALRLSIRDNGRGFLPEVAERIEGHYGLRGMQERASSLGTTLTIISNPEEGTTVTLLLPLAVKEGRPS
jgi:signal transduction histidine kinase/ligand-binding sensor domain-containing protein